MGAHFTDKAFIGALFFDGLESSTFKPLSKTKQRVDVPMICIFASSMPLPVAALGVGDIHHQRGLCMLLVRIVRKAVLEP